jgi:hypothetical protein
VCRNVKPWGPCDSGEDATGTYFAKRTAKGQFKELDEVGRSLAADRRQTAKKATKAGYGDQGDMKRSSRKR